MAKSTKRIKKTPSALLQWFKDHLGLLILTIFCVIIMVTLGWVISVGIQTLEQGQVSDYTFRAEEAIKRENYLEAYDLLQRALAVAPTDRDITLRLGDVAFLNGSYKVAVTHYKQAGVQRNAEIIFYQTLEALRQLDFTTALSEIELARLAIDPERPLAEETLLSMKEELAVIQSVENHGLLMAQTAHLLIDLNALFLAESLLEDLINEFPNYRDAYYLLGVTQLNQGDQIAAKASLEQALQLDPNYTPARELYEGIDLDND